MTRGGSIFALHSIVMVEAIAGGASRIPWLKVGLLLALMFLCFVLQVGVWGLELLIQQHEELQHPEKATGGSNSVEEESSQHDDEKSLYARRRAKAFQERSWGKAGMGYWNQFLASGILEREVIDNPNDAIFALESAANAGHPMAQNLLANAKMAGFYTISPAQPTSNSTVTLHSSVSDTWETEANITKSAEAMLLWQIAAINGNVEAMMSLAERVTVASSSSKLTKAKQKDETCMAKLPYLAAAAHSVIDELQSTVSIPPIKDKHLLHKVFLHGGTASQLDYDNRPDETAETLQFYHMRAMQAVTDKTASTAAFTLARFYHLGARGVEQNLTSALAYYDMAAQADHWEASGEAGNFYFYGYGTKPNLKVAYDYFLKGAAVGLNACRRKFQERVNGGEKIFPCDDTCLNGLGLVHLHGIPGIVDRDTGIAEGYFELARDQGNSGAAYNLAMMKLGWKTHFTPLHDDKTQQTAALNSGKDLFPLEATVASPTVGEYQSILTDLTTASTKFHLLARHRLALMYEKGVTIPRPPSNPSISHSYHAVVKMDCNKAAQHYKWIVENAAPQIVQRVRKAYKQYIAGDLSLSLRNYLIVAETGNELAQMNAAFLMEQGTCLGLNKVDCAKASVRLWKAAADKGNSEASLRVGDFYYYGRFRDHDGYMGPFGWFQHLIYPEEYLIPRFVEILRDPWSFFTWLWEGKAMNAKESTKDCSAYEDVAGDMLCYWNSGNDVKYEEVEHDLSMAAHYYRLAAEKSGSPRSHFNLGFMYQWGLGLKQDFPLAKRQYDLSITASAMTQEANVPVGLALITLGFHESLVKFTVWFLDEIEDDLRSLFASEKPFRSSKEPPAHLRGKTKYDVAFYHLFSMESFVIVALTAIASLLLSCRRTRG